MQNQRVELAVFIVALVAVVLAVATLARRFGTSAPLLLTVVGIIVGYLPGMPLIEVDREIVMLGLLPPLLYSAAIRTSLIDLKATIRGIGLLSVGLVIFTAVGVGIAVWALLGVPLPLAIAFGGVVAPPDAVAATAVAKRIGLPRQLVTLLEAESLFNDATALVIVRMGLVALGASVTVWDVSSQFLWAAGGGIAIGIAAAYLIGLVRRRITHTVTDTALSFLCPWLAYLPAEEVHASGVLSVVTAGVLLGHKSMYFQTAQSRIAERVNWATIQFVLENAVFLIIGLQAHAIVQGVADIGWARVGYISVLVLLVVILLRPLWIFTTMLVWRSKQWPWSTTAKVAAITSWAGMRGVVTIAAAFTLPTDAPERDLLVLLALVVTAGTLLIQGYSLPWLARALDLRGEDPREDALQVATVLERSLGAGEARLDALVDSETPASVVASLHEASKRRRDAAWERLGTEADIESDSDAYVRLRKEMIVAERAKILSIRDNGQASSDVLDKVFGVMDIEESMLTGFAERTPLGGDETLRAPEHTRGECPHLDDAPNCPPPPITPEGCEECLAEGLQWVNLRICLTCGHVGCCDSSPGQHAAGHFRSTDHPVMRSFEPGEEWRWCYVDSLLG